MTKWPINMSKYINYWVKIGSSKLQFCNKTTLKEKSFVQKDISGNRKRTAEMFALKTKHGEIIKRSWVCFSMSTGKLYCFHCKLFNISGSSFSREGFFDWKNSSTLLKDHEKSQAHVKAVYLYTLRSSEPDSIDEHLKKQIYNSKIYWKKLLKRLISIIFFLAERGLSFRGDDSIIGSPKNENLLCLVELLAEYDEFLSDHIKNNAHCGRGKVNYLSCTIYEELIEIIAGKLLDTIINEILISTFFAISVDNTKDASYTDQLVITIRYLKNAEPVERFITFIPNSGHKAINIFAATKNFLEECNIDMSKCRGQSYDNASIMSGQYRGLQALIKNENKLAVWVPCMAHSLNLVGTDAMNCCLESKKFFCFLENIYTFFTSSSDRFSKLTQKMIAALTSIRERILVPQRVSITRWSSRRKAVNSVFKEYTQYKEVLSDLS